MAADLLAEALNFYFLNPKSFSRPSHKVNMRAHSVTRGRGARMVYWRGGCHVCQRQCSCCCFLFLKIGFCWFARQLFSRRQQSPPPATSGWGPNDNNKDNKHIQLEAEQEQSNSSEWRRRFQCPPTGSWSGVLFVVRLSITNFYCNLLLFRARSSHSAAMWTHFEVVSKRGRGNPSSKLLAIVFASMCVCVLPCFTFKYLILFSMK